MSKEQNTTGIEHRWFRPHPQYKDSGVEWLGKIPAHWEARRLKYLSRIIMGQSPPSDIVNTFGEGLPFLQGNADFGSEHPTARTYCPYPPKVAAPEDILISVRAPVGAINSADREYGIGRGLCAIRPFVRQLGRRYCSYFLQVARSQLDSIAKGSTYDAVSADDVSCLMLSVPSIEEQHRISYFLDREMARIDALIEKKERLIELLQENRTALITQAVTKGLDPTVPMKDSGVEWLGKIPAHWGFKRLKRIVEFRGGGTPSKDNLDYWHGDILWVSPKDMKVSVVMDTEDKITPQAVRESATKLVPAGAVLLVVRSGILMHSIPVALSGRKLTLNQDLKALIPRSDLLPEYLFYLISGMQRKLLAEWKKEGATVESLEIDLVAQTQTPLPDEGEQHGIAAFLDRQTAKIDALMSKIREAITSLREYRTALISAVVTGKIDVREV